MVKNPSNRNTSAGRSFRLRRAVALRYPPPSMSHKLKLPAVLLGVLIAAGCSSTRPQDPALTASRNISGDPIVTVETLYREALDLYIRDRCDEAGAVLAAAAAALDAAAASDDPDGLRTAWRSKIDYFQGVLAGRGADWVRSETAEPARTDTLAVAVTHASPAQEVCAPASPITVVRNERVEKWLRYFQGRGRDEMTRWLSRAGKYRPMIDGVLAENGLPPELFYLSMIESGLNPKAYSCAHASGMWQFIESRGRQYGLRVDWWMDERRDPEKAARAAAAYLKDLHELLGSWELALAGYNAGEGRVLRAQRKHPSCPDYWCLDLPRETEDFVPKFMAAVIIGSDPQAFGFGECQAAAPLAYDTIEVRDALDLGAVAKACGTTTDEIKQLNPALKRWCTPPPGGEGHVSTALRVPVGTGETCLAVIAQLPPDERASWQRHEVRKGDTLSELAARYGTSVSAIMSVNEIRDARRIHVGENIVIPVGHYVPDENDAPAAKRTITYTVKKGDTISSIARRHGKDPKDLLRWNGLTWNSSIYPGDRIKVLSM
jgi:membrane-bound lytic murein transglycosylase D